MPAGGVSLRDWEVFKKPPPETPPLPTSSFGNPATFTAAANTQASDYDTIMKNYADLLSRTAAPLSSTNVTPQVVPPQTSEYKQSADVTGSLSNLSNLATTGGYSGADIQNIRERDISPIRSIYANAQQNVERQRALSGGYSPNFNAVQAQMARDEASAIGDRTTATNAGIAEMQARGRLSAAPSYASAAGSESALRTGAGQTNAAIVNQINEANANRALTAGTSNADRALEAQRLGRTTALGAIGGQASLYGTTPALTSTFGNQVMGAAQLGKTQQQIDAEKQRNIFGLAGRV